MCGIFTFICTLIIAHTEEFITGGHSILCPINHYHHRDHSYKPSKDWQFSHGFFQKPTVKGSLIAYEMSQLPKGNTG